MKKQLQFLLSAAFIMLSASGMQAQEAFPDSVFRDYEHMREVLDEGMFNRNIGDVMRAFGGSDEMTAEELESLEARVRNLFPDTLDTVDVMKSVKLGDNWTQEMYAYHADMRYIYATVLFNTREDAVVAVNFKFNTDPIVLLGDF